MGSTPSVVYAPANLISRVVAAAAVILLILLGTHYAYSAVVLLAFTACQQKIVVPVINHFGLRCSLAMPTTYVQGVELAVCIWSDNAVDSCR